MGTCMLATDGPTGLAASSLRFMMSTEEPEALVAVGKGAGIFSTAPLYMAQVRVP